MIEGQDFFMAIPIPLIAWAAGAAGRALVSAVLKRAAASGAVGAAKKLASKKVQAMFTAIAGPQLALEFGSDGKNLAASKILDLAEKLYEQMEKNGLLNPNQSTSTNKFKRHQRNPRKSPNSTSNSTPPARPNRRTG